MLSDLATQGLMSKKEAREKYLNISDSDDIQARVYAERMTTYAVACSSTYAPGAIDWSIPDGAVRLMPHESIEYVTKSKKTRAFFICDACNVLHPVDEVNVGYCSQCGSPLNPNKIVEVPK